MPEPGVDTTRLVELRRLLGAVMDPGELRRWLIDHYGHDFVDNLPTDTHANFLFQAAEQFDRHGLVDQRLFERLRSAIPAQTTAIAEVARLWNIALPLPARSSPLTLPFAPSRRSSVLMSLVLVVSAGWMVWSILGASTAPKRLPSPFGGDDPGVETIWTDARRAALAAAVETGPARLRAAWPVLRHALDAHEAVWRRARERGRERLLAGPTFQLQLSGLCLRDALSRLDHVLKSIEAATTSKGSPNWKPLLNQWRLDLMPPNRCTDPQFLENLAAQIGGPSLDLSRWSGGAPSWRLHEIAGYDALLAGNDELAQYHYSRVLADTDDNPSVRGYAHMRLADIARQRGHSATAIAHVESAIELAAQAQDTLLQFYAMVWNLNLAADSNDGPGTSDRALYRSARGLLGGAAGQSDRGLRTELAKLDLQMAWSIAQSREREASLASCPIECNEKLQLLPSCAPAATPTHDDCARDLLSLAEEAAPDDDSVRMEALLTRAYLALKRGDNEAARHHADAVLMRSSSTSASFEPRAYVVIAQAASNTGDSESAESFFRLALGRVDTLGGGQTTEALDSLVNLATLTHRRGAYADALAMSERARTILVRDRMPMKFRDYGIIVHAVLSELYLGPLNTRNDLVGYDRALAGLELGRATSDALERGFLSHIHVSLARLGLRRSDRSFAARQLESAKELGQDIDPEFLAGQDWLRAELARARGDAASARQLLAAASDTVARLSDPPARHLTLHLTWLRARLLGARAPEARRLAAELQVALTTNADFIDEFLDPTTLATWLTTSRQGSDRNSHGNEK